MTSNKHTRPFGFTPASATYDAWLRARVQEALDDPRPAITAEVVEAHFTKRRAYALRKLSKNGVASHQVR